MAIKNTEEQLNTIDKSLLVQRVLKQQKEQDMEGLPVDRIDHYMTKEDIGR